MYFPYLSEKVILLCGIQADGIYDLDQGKFHRISKISSKILQECDGTKLLESYEENIQSFIQEAISKNIVKLQSYSKKIRQNTLGEVLRNTRKPRFAWIEITSKCNQKCLHCFMGDDLNRTTHQPLEVLKKTINQLIESGIRTIVFSGGEPTLHSKFKEIIEFTGKSEVRIIILTNGSSIQASSLKDVFKENNVIVKISLLGWKKTHDQMTGVKGSFVKTVKTIIQFAKAGVHLELGTTVTPINIREISKIRSFSRYLGLNLEISPLFKNGYAKANFSEFDLEDQRMIITECQKPLKKRSSLRYQRYISKRITYEKDPRDYEAIDLRNFLVGQQECGQKVLAILANGRITPCLMLRDSVFEFGNIYNQDFSKVLSDDNESRIRFDQIMQIDKILICGKCEARYACKGGGCPASSWSMTGRINIKNPMFKKCYYLDLHEKESSKMQLTSSIMQERSL